MRRSWGKQVLIAFDQLLNAFACGWADETLSSRAYRCRNHKPRWRRAYKVINAIFFRQDDHCKRSYNNEVNRSQLPPSMRE